MPGWIFFVCIKVCYISFKWLHPFPFFLQDLSPHLYGVPPPIFNKECGLSVWEQDLLIPCSDFGKLSLKTPLNYWPVDPDQVQVQVQHAGEKQFLQMNCGAFMNCYLSGPCDQFAFRYRSSMRCVYMISWKWLQCVGFFCTFTKGHWSAHFIIYFSNLITFPLRVKRIKTCTCTVSSEHKDLCIFVCHTGPLVMRDCTRLHQADYCTSL